LLQEFDMEFRKIVCRFALLALTCASALAQEDPAAVYAKLHSATLAGNTAEVLSYGTAAAQAELASKPQAEKDAVVKAMAQVLPKTYTITEKTIAPDGNSAVLRGTGISEFMGRAESYLNAVFRKEGEVWKVATWAWSNQKPPAAAKPAAPVAANAPAADAAAPSQVVITRKVGPLPAAAAPAKPEVVPAPVAAAKAPSRAHLDARECLKLPTDKAIMACAEKFR
jgi:hypothetical protein